jgi:protein-L-isoaspartate(D-aspartate) O-methyltransferase
MAMTDLQTLRGYYAEELRAVANLQSEAFAKIPREHFLGSGPWQVRSPGFDGYWTTKDGDPKQLYHNVLVGIDPSRQLNNGHPSFFGFSDRPAGSRSERHRSVAP